MKRPRNPRLDTYDFFLPCEYKKRFATKKEAEEAADLRMLDNMSIELTVYECPVCRHWHLTRIKRDNK